MKQNGYRFDGEVEETKEELPEIEQIVARTGYRVIVDPKHNWPLMNANRPPSEFIWKSIASDSQQSAVIFAQKHVNLLEIERLFGIRDTSVHTRAIDTNINALLSTDDTKAKLRNNKSKFVTMADVSMGRQFAIQLKFKTIDLKTAEIVDLLLEMSEKLTADQLFHIKDMLPDKDEMVIAKKFIKEHSADVPNEAAQFWNAIRKARLFGVIDGKRITSLQLRQSFGETIQKYRQMIATMTGVCNALMNSRSIQQFFALVFNIGRYINVSSDVFDQDKLTAAASHISELSVGNKKEIVAGYRFPECIDMLTRLKSDEMRSVQPPSATLLKWMFENVFSQSSENHLIWDALLNVLKLCNQCHNISLDAIGTELKHYRNHHLTRIEFNIAAFEMQSHKYKHDSFGKAMVAFLESANKQLTDLEHDLAVANEVGNKVMQYFVVDTIQYPLVTQVFHRFSAFYNECRSIELKYSRKLKPIKPLS